MILLCLYHLSLTPHSSEYDIGECLAKIPNIRADRMQLIAHEIRQLHLDDLIEAIGGLIEDGGDETWFYLNIEVIKFLRV